MLTEKGSELLELDPVVAARRPDPLQSTGSDPVQDRGRRDSTHLGCLSGGEPYAVFVAHTIQW